MSHTFLDTLDPICPTRLLAVEDLCWQLAMDAWRAEQTVLTAKRQRLTAVAKQELDEL